MPSFFRRFSAIIVPAVVGLAAFGYLVSEGNAAGATPPPCNPSAAVVMCYKGSNVTVKPPQQGGYRAAGATCFPCNVSST